MGFAKTYFQKATSQLAEHQLPEAVQDALTRHWSGDLRGALAQYESTDPESIADEATRALILADRLLLRAKIGLGLPKDESPAEVELIHKHKASRFVRTYAEVCYYFWVDHTKAWQSLRRLTVLSAFVPCRGAAVTCAFLAGHLWAIAGRSKLGYWVGTAAFWTAWKLEATSLKLAAFATPGIYACYPYTLLAAGRLKDIHRTVTDLEDVKRDPFYAAIFLVSALYAYAYSADLAKTDVFVGRFSALHARGEFLRYAPVSKIVGLLPIALRGYGHLVADRLNQIVREHDPKGSDPLINSQFYRAAATISLLSAGSSRQQASDFLDAAEQHRTKCQSFQAWAEFDEQLRAQISKPGPVNHWDLKFLHIPMSSGSTGRLGDLGLRLTTILPEAFERGLGWFDGRAAQIVSEYFGLGLHKPAAGQAADLICGELAVVYPVLSESRRRDMRPVLTEVSLAVKSVRHTLERMLDMQKQLQEASKSVAVAKTAQMVAHDVRKPFSLLRLGLAELKRRQSGLDSSHDSAYLDQLDERVSSAMRDAQGMLNEVLESGRPSSGAPAKREALDPRVIVEAALDDIATDRCLDPGRIRIDWRASGRVGGSAGRLKRLFVNLIENALDAAGTGRVWIEAVIAEERIHVKVGNEGSIIPPTYLQKIFEPYFTHGKANGTGLGLALVKDVADEHGAVIEVSSSESEGTEFTVSLPLLASESMGLLFGLRRIAVVDDDPFVLDAWKASLNDIETAVFLSPEEFWSSLGARPSLLDDLDAVITDQYFTKRDATTDLPGGLLFANALKARRPGMPVLLSSDAALAVSPAIKTSIDGVIEKLPLSAAQLRQTIESALARTRGH